MMMSKCCSELLAIQFKNTHRNVFGKMPLSGTSSEQPKPFDSIPGLSSLPLIGSLHHFLPGIGELGGTQIFGSLGALREKYGPILKMEVFSRAKFLILYEPEHFEQVYRAEESNPLRPGFETLAYYREELRKSSFNGVYGLTTAQGPKWRDFRTKVNPALLKPKLVKLYAPGLEEIAKEMVARLTKMKEDGDYLKWNFELEMTKWSLESVALVGLGARLGCLRDDLTDDHPARQLIKCARDMLDLSFKLELLPNPWRYISTPSYRKIIKTFDMQWAISEMYINQTRQKLNERGHDVPEEDKSIIEKLLAIDEKVAVMMANEMLLAGIDTVAFATTNLLYHLAKNPEVQDKLRQQIRSEDPSNRYLRACLKEALRIWHIVPANLRRTSKEHVVGGYHIPKGIDVIAPNEYLSNQEKYYPRPKEFLPERWLAEKTDPLYYGNAHPMVTLPFGFGVRSCIGRRIAELEIEILVKRLLNEFNITWEGPPIKVVTLLTNSFAAPLHFKFHPIV